MGLKGRSYVKINMKNKLISKIKNHEAIIGVIGLGYVGLPLAVEFGKKFNQKIIIQNSVTHLTFGIIFNKKIINFCFFSYLFLQFNFLMAEEKINPSWMTADKTKKQVIFNLKAAYNGNNGSWNYNGFYNGSVELVVPEEWNVNIKFHNPDGNYRHSVAIIKSFDINAVPEEAGADVVVTENRSFFRVEEGRLYEVVALPEFGGHELQMSSKSDRFALFAMTFGAYAQGP